ncbi:ABC transporter substrate-binding protein [Ramlibacter sp. G-1-2-2]|uniref:ABC transporter substrate-binding protein n=1 Tax=Ramlibacter agri TaxID=2728837 RepID=A0A848HDR4_9BURK|nr:ABC transporter substrate-binding protein [Ramlibacter agri]NML48312.1 ABC transporter substrate-binding protein [Ramlibacter agri]
MKVHASLFAALAALAFNVHAAERVRFGLSWVAEAEHCGFFQAKAAGLYDKAGLDVEIVNGGPDRNLPLQIGANDLQLAMGSSFTTLHMLQNGVPAVTVAAFFQKDPQTLVAHPDQGVAKLQDLKGRQIMVAKFSQQEYWQFLKRKYGFVDDQLRPYTYSAAPFLVNPQAVQQGYITEDAMLLGKAMPKPPVSILLADYGYSNYQDTVFGTRAWVEAHPQVVQAFVDATRAGWQQCLNGDYTPAMKGILAMNPEHGEPLFHFKMKQIKERGLVDSGDAKTLGLGAMTDARWKDFFEVMSASGVYSASLDYKAAYTLRFVGKAAQ